jgi:hypothetical protein
MARHREAGEFPPRVLGLLLYGQPQKNTRLLDFKRVEFVQESPDPGSRPLATESEKDRALVDIVFVVSAQLCEHL